MTAHAHALAGETSSDASTPLILAWRKTYPESDADYSAFSRVYPGPLGRIYRNAGDLHGQWFWSMTADGYDISRNAGRCNGFERSLRSAAKCLEDAWFAAIKGSSLDRTGQWNADAVERAGDNG